MRLVDPLSCPFFIIKDPFLSQLTPVVTFMSLYPYCLCNVTLEPVRPAPDPDSFAPRPQIAPAPPAAA